jgi:pyridoxal phosphate enzyme (YggS family)
VSSARAEELAAGLTRVRARIEAACVAAGRDPAEVTLLPVTKNRPASDVALLADLGLRVFGENRPQEAATKAGELDRLRPGLAARWHLIGRLQRNKARAVVGWAARVESVDSARLAEALAGAADRALDAGERSGPLSVLIQVSLDGDPGRGGAPEAEVAALAERIAGSPGLALHGVMAVAPLGADPDRAFATLAAVAARLRADHPGAVEVSAGMSADLEAAIRNGSTSVRVGTALVGERPLTFR